MRELTINDLQSVSGGVGSGVITGLVFATPISAVATFVFAVCAAGSYLGNGDAAIFGMIIVGPLLIGTAVGSAVDWGMSYVSNE